MWPTRRGPRARPRASGKQLAVGALLSPDQDRALSERHGFDLDDPTMCWEVLALRAVATASAAGQVFGETPFRDAVVETFYSALWDGVDAELRQEAAEFVEDRSARYARAMAAERGSGGPMWGLGKLFAELIGKPRNVGVAMKAAACFRATVDATQEALRGVRVDDPESE